MPDGVVQWFDPGSGRASIVRGGRVYAAEGTELEPVARHPGAHVHFDIRREQGAELAVDVRLRAGTRVSRRQRRYGTLSGARRPDTKGPAPFAHAHPERGRMLAAHPLEVAHVWADCLSARDLDGALSLYASDAVVHAGGEDHRGRSGIGAYLESSSLFGVEGEPVISGEDGAVVTRWVDPRGEGVVVDSRIAHGLISEQSFGHEPASAGAFRIEGTGEPLEVAVVTRGGVSDGDVAYALQRIGTVIGRIVEPVLFARLKLDHAPDPARAKPELAQVAIDVNGELVRAHVAAHTMPEAADLLRERLSDKLDQRAQHRDDLRTRTAEHRVGEWRHGDLPAHRPAYYDRPPEERELVRHKTFSTDDLTPDEVAFDMDQLDYDFHLFRDLASGEDAVLARAEGGSYRLHRLLPSSVAAVPAAIEVTVDEGDAPVLSVQEAKQRLDASGDDFVFFSNAATRRGNVVYRRYDGHYGLITPAECRR